jgi:hypothetical protein
MYDPRAHIHSHCEFVTRKFRTLRETWTIKSIERDIQFNLYLPEQRNLESDIGLIFAQMLAWSSHASAYHGRPSFRGYPIIRMELVKIVHFHGSHSARATPSRALNIQIFTPFTKIHLDPLGGSRLTGKRQSPGLNSAL